MKNRFISISLSAVTIRLFIAFTAVVSVNSSQARKLDEDALGSVKCTSACTPEAYPPPPPPPIPCPPPPALPPPPPKKTPSTYFPPPPPSAPYINNIQGPPGDLYPIVQDVDGSGRGSPSAFLIGFSLLFLLSLMTIG